MPRKDSALILDMLLVAQKIMRFSRSLKNFKRLSPLMKAKLMNKIALPIIDQQGF